MAAEQNTPEEDPPKTSKMSLILGLVLALIGGGGGFYATWSGMILDGSEKSDHADATHKDVEDPFADIAFVEIEPLTISVDAQPQDRLLRFRAQLEVPKNHAEDVTKLLPRVVDVLNSYLRALELTDLEDQTALTRLRAQMLRRVQVVTGQDRVNDFLIMEFVLT
ncbi:flagellar basal body-associated FliL family protein [uncultured Sulfitobacter sp.]|uniref:flagellar basal body-associated FliL family protein n=1 Tax=uncultured Sulfitobacter sp. TaxID=191468 RepID=UPI00260D9755|nr:flagellar basal body-associated FliL family protein [uncultured Sulfitobacter sp.]